MFDYLTKDRIFEFVNESIFNLLHFLNIVHNIANTENFKSLPFKRDIIEISINRYIIIEIIDLIDCHNIVRQIMKIIMYYSSQRYLNERSRIDNYICVGLNYYSFYHYLRVRVICF